MHEIEGGVQQRQAGLVSGRCGDLGQNLGVPLGLRILDHRHEACAPWDFLLDVAAGLFPRDPRDTHARDDFRSSEGKQAPDSRRSGG